MSESREDFWRHFFWECLHCGKQVRPGFIVCGTACAEALNTKEET